ncbi:MAG: DUF885 family protein [Planctomycetes bacterium]|nr:DUF885 family protein [Planctomycetota bacterium]
MRTLFGAALAMSLAACGFLEPEFEVWGMPELQKGRAEKGSFAALAEAYVSWHYATHPTSALEDGVYAREGAFEDFSAAGLRAERDAQRTWLTRVRAIDPSLLAGDAATDQILLEWAIRRALVRLEEIREWERNPDFYLKPLRVAFRVLAYRPYAPVKARQEAAIARLEAVAGLLDAAMENLTAASRLHVEAALEACERLKSFLEGNFKKAFSIEGDEASRERFTRAQDQATAALEKFREWLRADLWPRASGAFAMGEERLRILLESEEMETGSPEEWLAEADAILEEARAVESSPPKPMDSMAELRRWAGEHVCEIPADGGLLLNEAPETGAGVVAPGPFDAAAVPAVLLVRSADPPEERALDAARDAYPGVVTRLLWVRRHPSAARRAFRSKAAIEGWAALAEERTARSRPRSLRRACRFLAGLRMRAGSMNADQAVDLFVQEVGCSRDEARSEVRRLVREPDFAALGRSRIAALRKEFPEASEREFTERFLAAGAPPVAISRLILARVRR